ncbi:unnamed protein product, partial [Rotaria sp. Silwood2]
MLLGCYYQIPYPFGFSSIEEAFNCFQQALELQPQISNAIPCEVYEFRSECQTLDELMIIRNDEDAMMMQALLVYERLLPSRSETHILVSILIEYVLKIYEQRDQIDRCILLLVYAYNLSLSCKENSVKHWDQICLSRLQEIFRQLILRDDSVLLSKM